VTIKEKRDHKKPDHGMVAEALEVFNQRDETLLAYEPLLLVKRRVTL
jgi:acyl dehydratase